MYLHLGQDVIISEDDVVGIFDMDNTTGSYITRKFLGEAEKAGQVISVSDELPNSFVVCDRGSSPRRFAPPPFCKGGKKENHSEMRIYLSQLSPQTLLKRSGTMRFE